MQGRLTDRRLRATIETTCAHCDDPMRLEVDSDLRVKVLTPGARPVIALPVIDVLKLNAPSITEHF